MEVFPKALFFSAQTQEMKIDKETQSRYWEVRSKNLQFSYFDVPPNTKFAMHSHESEQMTYVISGTLYFEVGDEIFGVGPGDLISIPSNKSHSAWTGPDGARAVDAWSPVNANL